MDEAKGLIRGLVEVRSGPGLSNLNIDYMTLNNYIIELKRSKRKLTNHENFRLKHYKLTALRAALGEYPYPKIHGRKYIPKLIRSPPLHRFFFNPP